jgi:hypothetical protein
MHLWAWDRDGFLKLDKNSYQQGCSGTCLQSQEMEASLGYRVTSRPACLKNEQLKKQDKQNTKIDLSIKEDS